MTLLQLGKLDQEVKDFVCLLFDSLRGKQNLLYESFKRGHCLRDFDSYVVPCTPNNAASAYCTPVGDTIPVSFLKIIFKVSLSVKGYLSYSLKGALSRYLATL